MQRQKKIVPLQAKLYEMSSYQFNLNAMRSSKEVLKYTIDDTFFSGRENSLVCKGKVEATIEISKEEDSFSVLIGLKGTVTTTCMRCLDELLVDISAQDEVKVKLSSVAGEDDEFIYVAESEGILDFEPLLYDYIVLAVPPRHVHEEGKCNKEMDEKLKQYLVN